MAAGSDNLKYDPKNANKGSVRGRGMLERSLSQYGAGRSVLVDKNGVVIAGNKTAEVAQELGIPIEVIESDGMTLYAIKRTDLDLATDTAAQELGIADNRSSEVGLVWAPEVLAALQEDGVDTSAFWFEPEWDRLMLNDASPWSPALDPTMSTQPVTAEQLASARDKLDDQFKRERALQPVTCPHCGGEFFMDQEG